MLLILTLPFQVLSLQAQTFRLENYKEICCDSLYATKPVWNANGANLLLTGANNRGLYLLTLEEQSLSCLDPKIKIKAKPVWLKNGQIIYLKGNTIGMLDQFKYAGACSEDTFLFVNTRRQKIEATATNTSAWEITPEKALYYNPLISPDRKLAVIHLQSEMYLYSTDGSGFIRNLGTGLASTWSPDSKYVFYFLDESSNGHTISNSELFVISSDGQFKQKLTETENFYEMWPAISPDGKKLAFSDEKTGKIFIANLIKSQE
jgi:Tol biopolymer transport system component